MAKIIADSHYDIGGYREVYEDRVKAQAITTAGGLKLTIAAVADGVGGENKGERASQTALDALYGYLEKSKEREIPELLKQSVQYANKAVVQLQHETNGASTTLAVAVVDESTSRLFIANVGDSRIYLCRNKKLTQLTIDHSWATVMVWQGKVSPEAARDHPRANVLMRALGSKPQVDVDLGFYVGTTNYEEANERGYEGVPLQDGDSVLVCSDGLVKDSPKTGEALITTDEIVRTLNEKEGKKAAQELVSFALGRGSDDNISAGVIQMPDRWRHWRARQPLLLAGGVIFSLAIVLGLVVIILIGSQKKVGSLTDLALNLTSTANMKSTISAYTPTPTETPTVTDTPTPSSTPTITYTPSPTLFFQSGQAGVLRARNNDTPFQETTPLPAGDQNIELFVYNKPEYQDNPGYVFALPNSLLSVDFVNDQRYRLLISPNSKIFVVTGSYPRAEVQLANVTFAVEGSCLAVDYQSETNILVSCYSGSCTFQENNGLNKGIIPTENQSMFNVIGITITQTQSIAIPVDEARSWIKLLPVGNSAYNCANKYIPLPTATFTPRPTFTRTNAPRNPKTDTPMPVSASNTPKPAASNTPKPAATNTPRPPTLTSAPNLPTPTKTPQPPTPTKTQQPPTATKTPQPPTATKTQPPPSPTKTQAPPTATKTPKTPTATKTPRHPSDTPAQTGVVRPTNTPTPKH